MMPSDREIVATRTVDAPRDLVWRAFTEPEHIANWWGPSGFTNTIEAMDVRPGGHWRFVMHGPDGTDYPNEIVYVEVAPPARLVFDHVVEPHFRSVVTLTERDGRTTVHMRMTFATKALRDETARTAGAVEGLHQNLEKLAAYVVTAMRETATKRPEMVVSRVFDAPRALVYEAWTRPEQLVQWWGPRMLTTPVAEVDVRPGGAYRIVMRGPQGEDYPFHGVYTEVVPGERLVFTNVLDDVQEAGELVTTVTFADEGGGTRVTVRQTVPAAEGPARGQTQGWTESLEKLGEYLARV